MTRRPPEDRVRVRELLTLGWSTAAVAETTGIPANTVRRWRRESPPVNVRWRPADEWSYAYLLGMYLGDGCVSRTGSGGTMFRVTLDTAYPEIVDECEMAMRLSWLECRVSRIFSRESAAVVVQSCGNLWLHAFPQHGRGFFSNLSTAIRDLFCAACDALGVRWTQSNPRNISISHRRSVAILDEIGCAKE